MSSVSYLYDNEDRQGCYTCNTNLTNSVKVAGEQRKLECRMYTEKGIIFENRLTAQTPLWEQGMGLMAIVDNGVDTSAFKFAPQIKFKSQSRGGGGLSKYDCGTDFQPMEYINYTKNGYTEMVYVHHKNCPKSFISTALQRDVFTNDSLTDAYDPDNMLSDSIIMAARETVAHAVEYTDIVGIFGGSNADTAHYDGILAQAYWAYTGVAFFQSVKFTIDETVLLTGTYLHAKYGGSEIDFLFDSTQVSNPAINRFQTREEIYDALVFWLNNDVLTESGRRYVDATHIGNEIVATSRWSEQQVDLQMFVDTKATVKSWADCATFAGVSIELLQNNMSIDERPYLVNWRKYTIDNILTALPNDIFAATIDMREDNMLEGQRWSLFIDPYLWKLYLHALQIKPSEATGYDLRTSFENRVHSLRALGVHGGTGIWFVTATSDSEELRNLVHLVDVQGNEDLQMYVGMSANCREVEFFYETLHGVMVRDFRLFASNLLCSPFAKLLKEPYEKTLQVLPCYDKRVRERFIDPVNSLQNCKINARFVISDEYINGAIYALPDGLGGFAIFELAEGETAPVGALPVYEIQISDTTTGIPVGSTVTYEYVVTTAEGTEFILTDKNPVIQYIGAAAGLTFNIVQTVSIEGGCTDTFVASQSYGADFPFELQGECNTLNVLLKGTVFRSTEYVLTKAANFTDSVTAFVNGVSNTITMAGAASVADIAANINAWFLLNGYVGTATAGVGTVTVDSAQVIFISSGLDLFVNDTLISIEDFTAWDSADGLASVEIDVALLNYTALPDMEATGRTAVQTVTVDGSLVSKLGCNVAFEEVTVPALASGEYFVNFELV
jgi:hypothetical protein